MATRSLPSFLAPDRTGDAKLPSSVRRLRRRLFHALLEARRRKAEHEILVFLETSRGNLPSGAADEIRRRLAQGRNAGAGDF